MTWQDEIKKFRKKEKKRSQDKSILTFLAFCGIIILERKEKEGRTMSNLNSIPRFDTHSHSEYSNIRLL